MGTTLTGLTPATTYDALLKTTDNQPLTTSLKVITDGLGNNSAFSLSTLAASITGTLAVSSTLTASNLSGTNTGDETNATIKSKLGIATTSVDGYLTSTDWTTFNNKVATTRSISTTAPLSGGGDLSANRTLSIPAATTSVDGYLTAANWTTFNAKVGGSGTTNYVPKFSGASAIGNSQIFDNGTNVGIGTASPSNKLSVVGTGYFTGAIITDSSITAGTTLDVGTRCQIGSLGDNEYRFTVDTGVVSINANNFYVNNSNYALQFTTSGLSGVGPIQMGGALSGATTIAMGGALSGATSISMGGALTGATDITGSGKLSIANIGASGTLNVGSTTTATKRLELTADNNSGENNTLRFVDTDTTASANQVIGKIEFFGSDASAPGGSVKAYISAHSLDTTPDAYLDFATDQVTGTPIVRQRIQADGKVLIGSTTDNGSTNLLQVSGGLDYNIVVRNVNSNNFSLVLTDKGKFLTQNSATSATITIPTNASVAFPIGSQIFISQCGSGILTINGDTGVTLRTRSTSRQPFARFSEVKLTKIATDEWYLTGDLKA